ncbi:FadR/GntR family transcriptional regulator [Arthrobacter sp. CG_A4]|uniref:FadR/GntR family transcriptional regulator n=1 Tax=Arthrobacter sp. CG_A4 TaxID=3071706 RepID=UPI002E15601B
MNTSETWAPVRQGTISSLISQRILEVIEENKMQPGDRLPPERNLAALLGVGRPSLREALHSLKAQGKIEIRHGSGVFVAQPETARNLRAALYAEEVDLEELFDMREVLELAAAGWAADKADPEKLKAVEAAYEAVTAASLEPEVDWDRLQELDAAFHLRIVEAAGNRFLARIQGVLQEIISQGLDTTLRVPGRIEKSREDHARILAALIAGDSSAARRAVKAHIGGARKAALNRRRDELAAIKGD